MRFVNLTCYDCSCLVIVSSTSFFLSLTLTVVSPHYDLSIPMRSFYTRYPKCFDITFVPDVLCIKIASKVS